jgi:hypothetical protein
MALHDSVRDALPIRLGDRKYNIDLSRLARATIDPIRQGYDTQGQPGEQSLNQAGVWKRTRSDWELGAGQQDADMMESTLREYHTSLGIDPWTKGEIKLHKATSKTSTPAFTTDNVFLSTGGSYVYMTEGQDIYASTDGGQTWPTTFTMAAPATVNGIASDGTNLFVADAAGIATVTGVTPSVTAIWALVGATDVWVANGYLLAAVGPRLTNLSGTLAAPTAPTVTSDIAGENFTQVDEWKEVIGTPVGIFAAGNKGTRGRIYYVGINDSTSALNAPVIAAELPDGETVNTLVEYGGIVVIGTSKGIRTAQIAGDGYLTYGPRIAISGGVTCLEEQGEFVWFAWSNYDGTHTGLGRLGLSEFTGQLIPAYASDLMASAQGPIRGLGTVTIDGEDRRLFTVYDSGTPANTGAWLEDDDTYVTSGTLEEGRFRWGITELKSVVSVDMRHSTLATGESVAMTVIDDAAGTSTVTSSTVGTATPGVRAIASQIPESAGGTGMNPVQGEFIIPSLTLTGPGTSTPTLYRWTVRAIPMPFVAEIIQLPIILTERTEYERREVYQDIYAEYAYIKNLLEDRDLALFIMGDETKNVYVSGVAYEAGSLNQWTSSDQQAIATVDAPTQGRRDKWPAGILTVTLITVQTGKDQYLIPTAFSSTG